MRDFVIGLCLFLLGIGLMIPASMVIFMATMLAMEPNYFAWPMGLFGWTLMSASSFCIWKGYAMMQSGDILRAIAANASSLSGIAWVILLLGTVVAGAVKLATPKSLLGPLIGAPIVIAAAALAVARWLRQKTASATSHSTQQ